jgi:hypothetical protein
MTVGAEDHPWETVVQGLREHLFTTPRKTKRTHDIRQLRGIGKPHLNRRVLKRVVMVMSIACVGRPSHQQSFMVTDASLDEAFPGLAWAVDVLRKVADNEKATAAAVNWWVSRAAEIEGFVDLAKNLGLPASEIACGIWHQYGGVEVLLNGECMRPVPLPEL